MRARRVIRRGVKRTVGKFPTLKPEKRSVHWDSQLERDLYFLLEIDPDVISFEEQPLKIEYVRDGKKRYYTPDLLVNRENKKQIVEVKPKSKVEKYDLLFRIVSPICCQHGYEFVVITDEVIRQQPRLDNVKLLWKYSRVSIHPQHQIACHDFFTTKHEAFLGEIIEFFRSKGVGRQAVYALLYKGILEIDLTAEQIGVRSVVRLPRASMSGVTKDV